MGWWRAAMTAAAAWCRRVMITIISTISMEQI
jgi:hypothetical protein